MRAFNRRCYLCQNKQKPGIKSSFSLHKFPMDAEIRSLWVQVCDLYAKDDVTALRICSSHFVSEDYIDCNAKRVGGLLKLKLDAVPSVSVPNPIKINKNLTFPPTSTNSEIVTHVDNAVPNPLESTVSLNEVNEFNSKIFRCSDTDAEPKEPTEKRNADIEEENVLITPKIKRFIQPRYVGDITFPDLSTSNDANRPIFMAKETISKQSKRIKTLQQKNRRLIKRITSLNELILHLRKKILLSVESGNALMI